MTTAGGSGRGSGLRARIVIGVAVLGVVCAWTEPALAQDVRLSVLGADLSRCPVPGEIALRNTPGRQPGTTDVQIDVRLIDGVLAGEGNRAERCIVAVRIGLTGAQVVEFGLVRAVATVRADGAETPAMLDLTTAYWLNDIEVVRTSVVAPSADAADGGDANPSAPRRVDVAVEDLGLRSLIGGESVLMIGARLQADDVDRDSPTVLDRLVLTATLR